MTDILPLACTAWKAELTDAETQKAIAVLENGGVLLFPRLGFELASDEHVFLTPDITNGKAKNISFDGNKISGAACQESEAIRLTKMMSRFSQCAGELVNRVLPVYQGNLRMARTSYRPVEVSGRKSSYRKDDSRLHVDAFSATPMQGQRILRVFTNVNPHGEARLWRVGESFGNVAKRFLPKSKKYSRMSSSILHCCKLTKTKRSPYDHYMLQLHNAMKRDLHYQKNAVQKEIHFAPGSTWIVFTDQVSHAAMQGQYSFEQSFYLPVNAMQNPERSPLKILEKEFSSVLA